MIYTKLINAAIDLSYKAHHGQKDKAGRPYFLHPVIVAEQMNTEQEICAALLHDVLEDTEITAEDLRKIFPLEIVEAVEILTHKDGESYFDYVRQIKNNPIARKIKLADLNHNMDITRIQDNPELLKDFERRKEKYERAKQILTD